MTHEFKTCPDCAEQVRQAARKCRSCGFMFPDAPTNFPDAPTNA